MFALAAVTAAIIAACATTVQQEMANEPPTSVETLSYYPFQVKGYQNSYPRRRVLVLMTLDSRDFKDVCGELLICVENQQFATHNLGTRPFKATRLPRSASEVFVSSFVFRLVFFVGCKKTRLKTPSFRCVLNWR